MKRRQFGAMLATATFSLAGLSGPSAADASAQGTEPLEVENVTVTAGSVTSTVGSAVLAFDEGARTITFEVSDWTMAGQGRTISIDTARAAVEETDARTYAQIRAAMVDAFESRSASPLFEGLVTADVSDDSPVRVFVGSATVDGQLLFDRMTATGTAGDVAPEGMRELVADGPSVEGVVALGSSEWSRVTVQRGETELAANDVTIKLEGASVTISAPDGSVETGSRSLEFEDMNMNVLPPDPIPAEHVEFASRLGDVASAGSLSLSEVKSAAAESGVTVSNTAGAAGAAPFELTVGNVTEGGETVVSNFRTSGTLAELLQVSGLRRRPGDELTKEVIVESASPPTFVDYVFEVTGDLEKLEPMEDTGAAVDEVIDRGDRVRVEGSVGTGDDRFAFSGELIEVDTSDVILEIRER